MLKLALAIVGFGLAVLGVMTKTTQEDPDRVIKRPTWAGWAILVLLAASLGLSLLLEWRDHQRGQSEAAREELWQLADARMKLLDREVENPICAFISDLKSRPASEGADFNDLLFSDAVESAEELVAHFDLTCSPGGDWTVVGMFAKDRPTKPCFSSFGGICNAGILLWSSESGDVTKLKIVDKWKEPINAGRWVGGYSVGKKVAALTYYQRRDQSTVTTPAVHWQKLFGEAELLFAVDPEAGIWLRIPLRLGEAEQGDAEMKLSWFVADQPKIGLVQ